MGIVMAILSNYPSSLTSDGVEVVNRNKVSTLSFFATCAMEGIKSTSDEVDETQEQSDKLLFPFRSYLHFLSFKKKDSGRARL
jgi:hypothetical protein